MAECGESEYEMIEMGSLFDLKDSRLVRAEINSIDTVENTADITLLDACEELSELDTSAVEFFYHCEDSTGTIEDLARGHKAFRVGGMVYVLYAPENGDTSERFYIIGHVDIRLTKTCGLEEYIFMAAGDAENTIITIFDVAAMEKLDMDAFENLDAGSPEKPGPFPQGFSTNLSDWFNYNFEASVPTATVPYVVDKFSFASEPTPETVLVNEFTNTPVALGYCYHTSQFKNDTHQDHITINQFDITGSDFYNNVYLAAHYFLYVSTNTGANTHGYNLAYQDGYPSFSKGLRTTLECEENGDCVHILMGPTSVSVSGSAVVSCYSVINGSDLWLLKQDSSEYSLDQTIAYNGTATVNSALGDSGLAYRQFPITWDFMSCVGELGFYTVGGYMLEITHAPLSSSDSQISVINAAIAYDEMCEPTFYLHTDLASTEYAPLADSTFSLFSDTQSGELDILPLLESSKAEVSLVLNNCVNEAVQMVLDNYGYDLAKKGLSYMQAYKKRKLP